MTMMMKLPLQKRCHHGDVLLFVSLFVCLSPAGGGGLSRWLFGAIDLFSF